MRLCCVNRPQTCQAPKWCALPKKRETVVPKIVPRHLLKDEHLELTVNDGFLMIALTPAYVTYVTHFHLCAHSHKCSYGHVRGCGVLFFLFY